MTGSCGLLPVWRRRWREEEHQSTRGGGGGRSTTGGARDEGAPVHLHLRRCTPHLHPMRPPWLLLLLLHSGALACNHIKLKFDLQKIVESKFIYIFLLGW